MEERQQEDLQKGDMVITGGDYTQVPDGEQLKVHIGKTSKVLTDNYEKTEKVWKLVVPFVLDEEIEGQGQVYSSWFSPSMNPKSNFAKLLVAVYGKLPAKVDPTELEGKPLRITLVNKDKDGVTKQYVDSYFKPATDQKDVVVEQPKDVVVKTEEVIEMTEAELDELFDANVEKTDE